MGAGMFDSHTGNVVDAALTGGQQPRSKKPPLPRKGRETRTVERLTEETYVECDFSDCTEVFAEHDGAPDGWLKVDIYCAGDLDRGGTRGLWFDSPEHLILYISESGL